MALHFVYGNSGNGKSEYMYHEIAGMAGREPYQHYFVVVPEQFTMSSQKSLVDHSPNGVITNIDVVSFERLAYRVFDELGIHPLVMEETGKSLVLRRIVEEHESELTFLKRNLTKMGYIDQLKSVISELMQYAVTPEDLEDFLKNLASESALRLKLADILTIYRAFDGYLGRSRVTAERVPEVLTDVADESGLITDAVILFDGYTGFTPVQMKLVSRLMALAKDIYVTVTLDEREALFAPAKMEELFYMSHKMVSALTAAAGECGCEIADPVCIKAHNKSRFADSPVLAHLEQNIFRVPNQDYTEDPGGVLKIYSLLSPREELDLAAARIATLARQKGLRFREMAIVVSDMERYEKYADSILGLYDIPYFTDKKLSVLSHPLAGMIRSLLEMAETDCSLESVFAFLRSGLTGFTREETDRLENYCIEKGIRGMNRWKRRFIRPSARHGRIKPDETMQQEELAELNALRQRFVELIRSLMEVLIRKDSSVTEKTVALYDFLVGLKIEDQLRTQTESFEEAGEETGAAISRQVYRIVIDLLDKLVDLLGDEVVSLPDYREIMEAGLSTAKVGAIPPGNDCVILGDMERTRLKDVKVLFFLGVNDGAIPKKTDRQSILSQYDREMIGENDLTLAPGEREQVFLQRFYLYLNLTKPSEALYLTFSRVDSEGKSMRPSYLVSTLTNIFPELKVEEIGSGGLIPIVTPKSSLSYYLAGLTGAGRGLPDTRFKALHRWYIGNDQWNTTVRRLWDARFAACVNKDLGSGLAGELYGSVLYNSVTRMELFEKCAYSHFLEYGLKLAERAEYSFNAPDMGTMFHAILEKYGRQVDESYGWDKVTHEEQSDLLREVMEEAVLTLPNESLTDSARNAYVLQRIYRIMDRSLWAITQQLRAGDFFPAGYEVDFSRESSPAPGVTMKTVGSVDRVDLMETDDALYLKVTDYKSGNNSFRLRSLYWGLQLQLVVYLAAATEKLRKQEPDKRIVPAGIFYFHLDDPVVQGVSTGDDEQIEEAIIRMMRPAGLVNSDPAVYMSMDKGLLPGRRSDVIPLTLKKDGAIAGSGTAAASTDDFNELTEYAGRKMDQAAARLMVGDIDIKPFKMEGMSGCDYCPYRSVCGFDLRIPGYDYRRAEKLDDEEIWELIREENGK
ncbi:MAG: exodeoxyribonuclease V subunit gamma [Clostridiales bacterium]|nr:exodeoxyribonuclease V subunit gamma [Clostridiales bacterium]